MEFQPINKAEIKEELKTVSRKDWSDLWRALASEDGIIFEGKPPEELLAAVYVHYRKSTRHPHVKTLKDGRTIIYLDAK